MPRRRRRPISSRVRRSASSPASSRRALRVSGRASGSEARRGLIDILEARMSVKRPFVVTGFTAAVAAATAFAIPALVSPPALLADSLNCNLSQYKPAQGLAAAVEQDTLVVSWSGQNGAELRARYAI